MAIVILDKVVNVFSWAQWDVEHQCLYYIYNRKVSKSVEFGESKKDDPSPTISSLQFNDDFPHDTVVSLLFNSVWLSAHSYLWRGRYFKNKI